MKIATGHPVSNDEEIRDFKEVRFLTDEGRAMFEVRIGSDGRSLEVRGVECCKVDGVLYSDALEIAPLYANGIKIGTRRYEGS